MLTEKAYNNQKWLGLEILRKILEKEKYPNIYPRENYNTPSVFEQIGNFLYMTKFITHKKELIREAVKKDPSLAQQIISELESFEFALKRRSREFDSDSKEIKNLQNDIDRIYSYSNKDK